MTLLSGSSAKRSMKTWKIGLLAILGGRCGGKAPLATLPSSASSGFSLSVSSCPSCHFFTAAAVVSSAANNARDFAKEVSYFASVVWVSNGFCASSPIVVYIATGLLKTFGGRKYLKPYIVIVSW